MAYLTNDDKVTRIYSNFRGADFRGEEINLARSPDCLNVWKDYKETESIRTRPGMEKKFDFSKPVYHLCIYKDTWLAHTGTWLFAYKDGAWSKIYDGLNEAISNSFVYGDNWYFMDGAHYLVYDGETVGEVVGYIPTTTIARKPVGGGTQYEDVNMLSDYRKNTFLSDGASFDYYLDVIKIDADYVPEVTINDQVVSQNDYTVDYEAGIVTFKNYAPDAPLTDGRDNVCITFKKHVEGYKEQILKCSLLQVFDNRVFISGNENYPNIVWHCSLNDPTYFSDMDFYREGLDSAHVKGLVAGNNALWVFREPSHSNTTVFYHTPSLDDEYGKIYPSSHSSVTTGCVGRAINFNDDIVFFSERGMEGISGDVTTEQVLGHRSTLVDRKLTSEADYQNMILEEWEGYLLVIIGDKVYLADSRMVFTNENHIEYDWFYWQMEKPIISTCVQSGVLYLGTSDGVYTLTDNEKALESYWVTPKDKFKHPHKLKTTNKRGCTVEATGDVSVWVKTEKSDFELVESFEGVEDYFVSRIKRKKFKDLQVKFQSSTRFSLETASLEVFVGGYIKR